MKNLILIFLSSFIFTECFTSSLELNKDEDTPLISPLRTMGGC